MRQRLLGALRARAASPLLHYIGPAAMLALAVGCGGLLLAEVRGVSPSNEAMACLKAAFRDPVTGREQGIGPVRVQPDGAIICRSGVLHRISR